jgi:uncharacterized protein with von Willebrand factor type A (vWA) domain
MSDTTATIAHFLGFTALLRRSGFAVAPEQSMAWLTAIELLGPGEIGDIRRAARATLAPPPILTRCSMRIFSAPSCPDWRVSQATRSRCAPPRTGQ